MLNQNPEKRTIIARGEITREDYDMAVHFLGKLGMNIFDIPEKVFMDTVEDMPDDSDRWSTENLKGPDTYFVMEHIKAFKNKHCPEVAGRPSSTAFIRLVEPKSTRFKDIDVASSVTRWRTPLKVYTPEELGLVVVDRSQVGLPPPDLNILKKSPPMLAVHHYQAVQTGSFLDFYSRYQKREIDQGFTFSGAEDEILSKFYSAVTLINT